MSASRKPRHGSADRLTVVPNLHGLNSNAEKVSELRRGSLFKKCDPSAQKAIVELRSALEVLSTPSNRAESSSHEVCSEEVDEAVGHIEGAMDALLYAAPNNTAALVTAERRFRGVTVELTTEVANWLSATYSPRRPPLLTSRFDSFKWGSGQKSPVDESRPNSRRMEPAVEEILADNFDWTNFNVIRLHEVSGGHSLSILGCHLFDFFGLYNDLNISETKVQNFWERIEDGYQNLPYHNSAHAADVLNNLAFFLNSKSVRPHLTAFEICACLVAAGIHDHDHPGYSNDFLVKTGHELAMRYNDQSVLENHHASTGLSVLQSRASNHFLAHLDSDSFLNFRKLVISMVLATDMSGHFELQLAFEALVSKAVKEENVMDTAHERELMLKQLIHCADLCNTCKSFDITQTWGRRVMEEFFRQGDKEKELGLPVSPMNSRTQVIEKVQMGFISHIVQPMLESMTKVVPEVQEALDNAQANHKSWNELLNNRVNHSNIK